MWKRAPYIFVCVCGTGGRWAQSLQCTCADSGHPWLSCLPGPGRAAVAAWLLQQPLSRFRAHSDSLRLHTSPLIHFLRPTTALSRVTNLTSQNIKLIKGHSTLGFHFFFFNKVIYLQSQGALVESVEPIRGEVLIWLIGLWLSVLGTQTFWSYLSLNVWNLHLMCV